MTTIKHYQSVPVQPEQVQAATLSAENLDEVQKWCGGELRGLDKPITPTSNAIVLLVPSLQGAQQATIGEVVVRLSNGRFCVMQPGDFYAKYQAQNLAEEQEPIQGPPSDNSMGSEPGEVAPTPEYTGQISDGSGETQEVTVTEQ